MTKDTRHRPDRRLDPAYREKALKRDRERYLRLKGDPALMEKQRKNAAKMVALYPEKTKARRIVRSAIEKGEMVRMPCVKCGHEPAHGHHEDYSKPLDVVWLCSKHHAERHREIYLRAQSEARV